VYARVSSKEQEKDGFSIPAQERLLRDYAAANGIEIVREFTDVETAKRAGRTGFGEMLTYLGASKDVRILLVEKTDRLYRNFRDWVTIDEFDLDLHFVKEGVVLTPNARSSEKFVHGIKVLMAKNYVDNLSEETRKGMQEKAEQGIWPSFAPLGYRNIVRADGKRVIEPDPDVAPAIERLFAAYSGGDMSLRDLAKQARSDGLRFRKSASALPVTSVQQILKNPIYMGEFDWKGRRYPGVHDPVVTRRIWDRAQEVSRLRAARPLRGAKPEFTYWGLVDCGHCGCAVVGEIKKQRYVYYRPTRHPGRCEGSCGKAYVREERFDAVIEDILRGLRFDAGVIDWLRMALRESKQDEVRYREAAEARLTAEQVRLQKRIDAAYLDRLDGRITVEQFDQMAATWREEQAICGRQAADLQSANAEYHYDGLRLLELARNAADLWKVQPPSEKRALLKTLVSNCHLVDGELRVELRQPFDLLREIVETHERLVADEAAHDEKFENWLPELDSNQRPFD
jgi:site-specific DNA recombinase